MKIPLSNTELELFKQTLEYISKQFGAIKDTRPVIINGDKGFLVWDHIIFHEITFVNSLNKEYTSMFTSFSKSKTEKRYNELLEQYSN